GHRGGGSHVRQVKLYDFIAVTVSYVLNINADLNILARLHSPCAEPQVAVLESRIAQAVAERIERLSLEVAIGLALHVVIVKGRQLIHGFVEGDGQASGRIVIAE